MPESLQQAPPEDGRARVLLHAAPSWSEGGRELRAVQLMAMLGSGYRHVLYAHDACYDALRQVDPSVCWERIDVDLSGGLGARTRAMRETIGRHAPDALLTYNWGSIEWLLAARRVGFGAVIHHEDGFGPDEVQRRLLRRNLARRFLIRHVQALVVPSEGLASIARREWGAGELLRYFPNGVDTERFRPAPQRAADGDVVFVCVGRLRPEKNQRLAVAALARADCRERARLVLVGDGPDEVDLRAEIAALGVAGRVDLVGKVEDTAPHYRDADVFLIPSNTEQMPLSLLEAMASGLAVAGTDVGDVRSMLAPENRTALVDVGDVDGLAQQMDALARDPALRMALGEANRARAVSEYDREACYGRYCELYARVSSGPR